MSKRRFPIWVILGSVVSGVILPPLLVPIFGGWPEINCGYSEIDIKTGQARYSRRLYFMQLFERVEETPLSLALDGESVNVSSLEPWHTVMRSAPGQHSPNYHFHAAIYQAYVFERLARVQKWTPERKRKVARELLARWQRSERDFSAGEYLNQLEQNAQEEARDSAARRER